MYVFLSRLFNEKQSQHETIHPKGNGIQIFKSELDYISRCILDRKNIETGGQLFGYWSEDGQPVVMYAIGPGPRANHQTTFFNQDVDYLLTGELWTEAHRGVAFTPSVRSGKAKWT